jgi:DNA-binding response OmpR family regulator
MSAHLGGSAWNSLGEGEPAAPEEAARAMHERWAEITGAHLLVVDPRLDADGDAADMLERGAARGIQVTLTGSALDGLVALGRLDPDAIVVATDATDLSAIDFVSKVREHSTALVIAALDEAEPVTAGALMLAGASAAVTRPYSVEAVWDVWSRSAHPPHSHVRLSYGPIELDARAYTVYIGGERIADLPLKEFELLRTLMHHAPHVISNDELRMALWGDPESRPTDNTIAVHVGRLRSRLQQVARIRRIRGRGYSLTIG